MRTRRRLPVALLLLATALAAPVAAIDLQPRTRRAYDAYVQRAQQAFISRPRPAPAARPGHGVLAAGPASGDGILEVPDGLVHHWMASAFVPDTTLSDVLQVSTAYGEYSTIYDSVIASRVLEHQDDVYRLLMRLREGGAGITAVLDVRSTVRYLRPTPRTAIAISSSDEIREVENAGQATERLLPAGQDSGYLWAAHTLTWLGEQHDGVYMEVETIGLSRRFPALLGWIIEPIARRIGRKSVETSLQQFLAAICSRPAPQPPGAARGGC